MTSPAKTTIQCANCGQPVPTTVRTVIDATADPEGKSLLISGRLNEARCPNCGHVNNVLAPLLYHDAKHELLIAYVPMEVAMQRKESEERIIGDMMNQLTGSLPKEQFRAYMFNPKRALTMKGVVDQVLEAEGITPEVMEEQKQRTALIQQFLNATSMEELQQLVKDNDEAIDRSFMQALTMLAQRYVDDNQMEVAANLMGLQEIILNESSMGRKLMEQQAAQEQMFQVVANEIEAMGEEATRSDFRDLAIRYAGDPDRLQALVGLARPVFDSQFFDEFTQAVGKAPAAEREKLEALRDQLSELTRQVDAQVQQAMQRAAGLLQAVVNSPNPVEILASNAHMIDNNFMSVLTANIQEAQRRGDAQTSARLREIYDHVVELLSSQMSPDLRFLNELLGMDDTSAMRERLREEVTTFGESFGETIDTVEQLLRNQGGQPQILERLNTIRSEFEQIKS